MGHTRMKPHTTTIVAVLALAGCLPRGPVLDPLPPPIVRDGEPTPAHPNRTTPPRYQTASQRKPRSLANATIIIDAGHGGKDPGAQGVSRRPEKEIVLSIANAVARDLMDRGARVVRTRSGDTYPELEDRAAMANRHRATLFVSIHADSAPKKSASGSTVYVARRALPASRQAARSIQSAFSGSGIKCRGIRKADFDVLVLHSRPAVLVECGYLTNASDARRLNTASYRTRIAAAIADGIADFCTN